jgi:hypothetical protein
MKSRCSTDELTGALWSCINGRMRQKAVKLQTIRMTLVKFFVWTQFHVAGENLNGDNIYSFIFNRAWELGSDYVVNVSTLDAWRNRTWLVTKSLIATAWLFSCRQNQHCAHCNSLETALNVQLSMMELVPIIMPARFETRNTFGLWNTEIVGSNPSRSMDVRLSLFCVCGVLCR